MSVAAIIRDEFFAVKVQRQTLSVTNIVLDQTWEFSWPAVTLSVSGKKMVLEDPVADCVVAGDCLFQEFRVGEFCFRVSLSLSGNSWFFKNVSVRGEGTLPTPDYLEVDSQDLVEARLRRCGYAATTPISTRVGDEEGGGLMPGCGYPLIGNRWFAGLEHPAAFNTIQNGKFSLRHHPVWQEGVLEEVRAVYGWGADGWKIFADYLDSIRLPVLPAPYLCFCTFWTDPYLSNYEYEVSEEGFRRFFQRFHELGLRPDAFTLDAGWQNRRSILQSKPEVGGDDGLRRLRRFAETHGSELSLWVSHNGLVGMDTEYMQSRGFQTGAGASAAYSGEGYGVMLDQKLKEALKGRLVELVRDVGARHFKIDWDNDCATNASFAERYPTRNHVRQASLNAFFEISQAMRKVNAEVITRNGWWPSPWWLKEANHVWLPDSGDSEYTSLPSKNQRESGSTHRDFMYYAVLRRDETPLPLDCFDNHEFPDAFRNPFREDPVSWINTVWLAFMRGSTYVACMLQPEALEDWQAAAMARIVAFCRRHAESIFVKRGRMVLGNPAKGEIYGFVQPGEKEVWCALRNPRAIPQKMNLDISALAGKEMMGGFQFFPYWKRMDAGEELTFLAHELKIIVLARETFSLAYRQGHMLEKTASGFLYRFPSADPEIQALLPPIHPTHRIGGMRVLDFVREKIEGGYRYCWFLLSPYRTRELEAQFRLQSSAGEALDIRAFTSRYRGGGACAAPLTRQYCSHPGYGERKNADCLADGSDCYFSVAVPDGGEFSLDLRIMGVGDDHELEGWLAGYEAPTREGVVTDIAPEHFADCLPVQHPLGFPRAITIV